MRLRCRKCLKVNEFRGDGNNHAWVSRCAWCGKSIMEQFMSFKDMVRASVDLGDGKE